ncbi:MAG: PTS sugar transporter subunit IIA [Erysipelotrichaceae bacterium]|nr:PTS sugar transporter subunit IIA [Erysipelotrichaceae bacterium]
MAKILLLSHGNLADQFVKTAQMIVGEANNIKAIGLLTGEDMDAYKNKIKSYLTKDSIPTLILVDLFGGSPFITASLLYKDLKDSMKIEIVTGLNLGMLLEIMSNTNKELNVLANIAKQIGKDSIIQLSEKI